MKTPQDLPSTVELLDTTPKSTTDWALAYASLGLKVFPVSVTKVPLTPSGFKDATLDTKLIRGYWKDFPTAGIGIATGQESGIVVLDCDLGKEGAEEGLRDLVSKEGPFSQEVVVQTGGGGLHFYFRHPGSCLIPNAQKFLGYAGIDVRGDGGYVVVPPSPHMSGKSYVWGDGQCILNKPLPDCPAFLLKQTRSTTTFVLSDLIDEGSRNATLTSIAGFLRSQGLGRDTILHLLTLENKARCVPPLEDVEVGKIVSSILKYPAFNTQRMVIYANGTSHEEPTTDPQIYQALLNQPRTDLGYAEMVNLLHGPKIRYDPNRGQWYHWGNHFWVRDDRERIIQTIANTALAFQGATSLITAEDAQASAQKYALKLQNRASIESAQRLLRTYPQLIITAWDSNPDFFGLESGIVDLRTSRHVSGQPYLNMRNYAELSYNDQAQCPRWLSFLEEVLVKPELVRYIQKCIGYSLTGYTREQCLFLLLGTGANGKSVFLNVLTKLAGSYGQITPFSTFERTQGTSPMTNDLALLEGKRVVIASETNAGSSLHESRLKSLTGGEPVTARFLHQEFFTFSPICKIWLAVNHLPVVRDDSVGFWRRVRLVDFPIQFSEETQDRHLTEKLLTEIEGILLWALKGAELWYEEGLGTPVTVAQSTAQYRQDSDPLHSFLTLCLVKDDQGLVSEADLYKAYAGFSKEAGLKAYEILPLTRFVLRLRALFTREEFQGRMVVRGVTLGTEYNRFLEEFPSPKIILTKGS